MNKKLLILIGVLLLFTLTFANKTDGQGDEPENPSTTSVTIHLD